MREGHEADLREFENWQRETSRESRFETKRGTLVWSELPDRIRVEILPPMGWWRRCLLGLVMLLSCGLWVWIIALVGRRAHWW